MIHWWGCSLTPTEQMGAADVWRKRDKEQEQKGWGNIRIHPAAQWTAFQSEVVLRSCTTKRQMVSMAPHVSEPPGPLQFWFFQGASSNYSQSEPQDVNNPHDCSSQWMSLNNILKKKIMCFAFNCANTLHVRFLPHVSPLHLAEHVQASVAVRLNLHARSDPVL